MGRANVYLGTRVKDSAPKGLNSLREVRDIANEIIEDYERGRIDYATAKRRLVFMRTTVIRRTKKLEGKRRKAKEIVKKAEEKLTRIHEKREGKNAKKSKKGGKKKGKKR